MIRETLKNTSPRVWTNIYLCNDDEKSLIAKCHGKGVAWHMARGIEHVYNKSGFEEFYLLID